jgi:hypothetical protein
LNLVGCLLTAKGILFASVDGSLSLSERRKVLSDFHVKPEVTVLLMTMGIGAVG